MTGSSPARPAPDDRDVSDPPAAGAGFGPVEAALLREVVLAGGYPPAASTAATTVLLSSFSCDGALIGVAAVVT